MISTSLNQANGSVGNAAIDMPPTPAKKTGGIGITANFRQSHVRASRYHYHQQTQNSGIFLSAHGLGKSDSENIILLKDFLHAWLVDDVSVTAPRAVSQNFGNAASLGVA